MSIEHPSLRGWLPLRDGRNVNVSHIVWYRTLSDRDKGEEPAVELMLSNGITIELDDPRDRDTFAMLVRTIP